ncbi:MAG: acyltransferase family protein [Colwellia sp.]
MNYRKDIDGLRTIAVFLVILHHAGFSLFSGGFVGVDVFFVISGFLITTIIFTALEKDNFDIISFFGRRIKRLMPVLLFVIFITTIVFSFLMLPQDLMKYYRSVIWVIGYIGNFFFWREYGGYFDNGSQEVPLLHTWSLAVEEQYYFIWPIMLLFFYKMWGNRGAMFASLLLCITTIFFSQWGTQVTIGAAYYLLPTRFFELLVGSCLALSWKHLPRLNQSINHLLSCVGFLLICTSALVLNEHSSFPGYNALLPVIGTALIIYSSNGIVNQILTLKPMVFTGAISYSLYLWHWPVLVVFNYTSVTLNIYNQLLAITIIYIISILSWKYIEQPGRHINVGGFKPTALRFYLLPSAVLLLISLTGIYFEGYKSRFSQEILKMENALNSHSSKSRNLCHSSYRDSTRPPNPECTYGATDNNQSFDAFIFGDSHANHLTPFFNILAKDAGIKGQDYTLDRCLPIFGLKWGSNLHKANLCEQRNDIALEHIQKNNFKYVLLAASWPDYSTRRIFLEHRIDKKELVEKIFQKQLLETLNTIIGTGAIPIIVTDTPTLNGKNPKCILKNTVFNSNLSCDIKYKENKLMTKSLVNLKKHFPKLIIIEPHKLICTENSCVMQLNETPLYRDDDHLNEIGSRLLGKMYIKEHGNPFKLIGE